MVGYCSNGYYTRTLTHFLIGVWHLLPARDCGPGRRPRLSDWIDGTLDGRIKVLGSIEIRRFTSWQVSCCKSQSVCGFSDLRGMACIWDAGAPFFP